MSGDQCDGKWKGLKQQYKKIKDHNSVSGNSNKHWEYFDLMDEILNKRPEITPPATCSSDNPNIQINVEIETPGTSCSDFDFADAIEETTTTSPPSSLQRKRKAADDERNKRHAEKMARADTFLGLFQKLIDKL